jgi:hypothetical protein
MKFKNYNEFNKINEFSDSRIADLFKSIHGAINLDDLIPLKYVIGKPKFPTQEELDEVVDFLNIDPDYLYYDPHGLLEPIIYWNGPVFHGFTGGFNMQIIKMMQVDKRIQRHEEIFEPLLKAKKYVEIFNRMEKKILIPMFEKLYNDIPDDQKYDVFTDLYVRSEYGFQTFPMEIIKDCFKKRNLSKDWKNRMKSFMKTIKLDSDGLLTIYRGENIDSAKGDDAFSWTLDKKTAKFFSERFNKETGKIIQKTIDPKEVIDFLEDRVESEIIVYPTKFGKL